MRFAHSSSLIKISYNIRLSIIDEEGKSIRIGKIDSDGVYSSHVPSIRKSSSVHESLREETVLTPGFLPFPSPSRHTGGNNIIQSRRMSERANKRPSPFPLLFNRVTSLLCYSVTRHGDISGISIIVINQDARRKLGLSWGNAGRKERGRGSRGLR